MLSYGMVCGLDLCKTAMMCLATDRNLKGLIIKGPNGVGKTVLTRSVSRELFGREPTVIPMNATDEQVFGSVDIEATMTTGEMRFQEGLLSKSGDGFVCVDDINLMDRRFVHAMMMSIISGKTVVERDGISSESPCDVSIIATMNVHESTLPGTISDLFDMSVIIHDSTDPDFHLNVLKNNMMEDLEWQDSGLLAKVEKAREIIPRVKLRDEMLRTIVDSCLDNYVQGYRGELSTVRVCKALAALDGRTEVNATDLKTALLLCLGHRRTRFVSKKKKAEDSVNFFGDSHMKRFIHDDRKVPKKEAEMDVSDEDVPDVPQDAPEGTAGGSSKGPDEVVSEVGELFESIDLLEDSRKQLGISDSKMLRRNVKDKDRNGRYISSRPMTDGNMDLAIDATIRAAAPYQRKRRLELQTDRVVLEKSDLREKIREKRRACLFMFMVDNSGSLIVRGRMRAVKASILSLLATHYVRRDSVAVMTFNETQIGMAQPPTRSVGCIKSLLDNLSVGKKTPLSEALVYADQYLSIYGRKHPGDQLFGILLTDAIANIPLNEDNDPFEEAIAIAGRMNAPVAWIVVDTAANPAEDSKGVKLAHALHAAYYRMDDLRNPDGTPVLK